MQLPQAYVDHGLSALPADLKKKYPPTGVLPRWRRYAKRLPTETQIEAWFGNGHHHDCGVCIVTGSVSGNLEMIDFDGRGLMFDAWKEEVDDPELLGRLVIETSPSGGCHVIYRCESAVCGNMKLAKKVFANVEPDEDGTAEIHGKRYKVRNDGRVVVTMIETRGEGGLFLCHPSDGYDLVQGDLCSISTISEQEREKLLGAAWALNEHFDMPLRRTPVREIDGVRPGDEFNERGDVRAVLRSAGWTLIREGDNEQWCRPGKRGACSATLKDRVFYVFTTSTELEANKGYAPFSVYAYLEHAGDFEAAARQLYSEGYGGTTKTETKVDISNLKPKQRSTYQTPPIAADGGFDEGFGLDEGLLRVPGFIGDLMDFTLQTAPYPNIKLAFAGALAMMSLLTARKVRDPADNRTNLYLLALANSGSGKDWPRKVNMQLAIDLDMHSCLADHFASGEGIQDALLKSPAMLFQTDEIDGILQAMKRTRDARHESIMSTLLSMYSCASGVFPVRKKAIARGQSIDTNQFIRSPHLTLLGTAIPSHYYDAISDRMLTNGLFARMLIIEAGKRGEGQEPAAPGIPRHIIDQASEWRNFNQGDMVADHAGISAKTIELSDAAIDSFKAFRSECDQRYKQAEEQGNDVAMTVWSRVNENARKLALVHACSEQGPNAQCGPEAVAWGGTVARRLAERMLEMARGHVADSEDHAEYLRMVRYLTARGRVLHSDLLRYMKMPSRKFTELIRTGVDREEIVCETEQRKDISGARPKRYYSLADG